MDTKKVCNHASFWIVIAILAGVAFISMAVNLGFFLAMTARNAGSGSSEGQAEDEFPQLSERWTYGQGESKVVHISYIGFISRQVEQGLFGMPVNQVDEVLSQIRAARNDEDVKAILFEVDSPGGEVTPADEIYEALVRFRKSAPNRKVFVFIRDMAASGGYYMAAGGDWIMSEPTALIGSIGVIMQALNWKGLSEKIGVTDTTIKSVGNKDLLNPFHDVPPEQLDILQATVDTLHDRFAGIVQKSRDMNPERLNTMADGRVFTPEVALEEKFIDAIGYWEDFIQRAPELLGEKSIKVIQYQRKQSFFDMLLQARSPLPSTSFLASGSQPPRLMYIWKP